MDKVGLGGGCHWCTEAIFKSLKGVLKVEQGFISSVGTDSAYSEGVIIHYSPRTISLKTLIEIHLNTHSSTTDHQLRTKYRSGVYTFSSTQFEIAQRLLVDFQSVFNGQLITKIYSFVNFRPSKEQFIDYYHSNPDKPFCKRYIYPKLRLLQKDFNRYAV